MFISLPQLRELFNCYKKGGWGESSHFLDFMNREMRYFHAVFVRKSASDQGMAWSGRRYHPCSMCDEAYSQSSSDAIDELSRDTATNNLIPDQHT